MPFFRYSIEGHIKLLVFLLPVNRVYPPGMGVFTLPTNCSLKTCFQNHLCEMRYCRCKQQYSQCHPASGSKPWRRFPFLPSQPLDPIPLNIKPSIIHPTRPTINPKPQTLNLLPPALTTLSTYGHNGLKGLTPYIKRT